MIADARARIAAHMAAGAELYRRRETLLSDLVESTGLSAEGVRFAWERSFERTLSPENEEALLHHASPAASLLVVLSSNVFVAPMRAIACAVARSERIFVKPSSRDPHVVRALLELEPELGITVVTDAEAATFEGEVHVYGRASTIETYRGALPQRSHVVPHGPGFGVAWVTRDDDLDESAAKLADDTVLFEQRGCLSPRVTFVEGPRDRAEAFGKLLLARLEGHAVPRGRVSSAEEAEIRGFTRTAETVAELYEGEGVRIAVGDASVAPLVAPSGRNMYIACCDSAADPLGPLAPFVTVVGAERDVGWRPRGARLAGLGLMQSPPLDGPVDRRPRA